MCGDQKGVLIAVSSDVFDMKKISAGFALEPALLSGT